MQLFWFDPELPKKYPNIFSGQYPAKRNYLDISLNGNNSEDLIKLKFSQIRLRDILSKNDSINGIHYHFDDSAQYWSLVKALDICQIENAKYYLPCEDNLWVYHIPPDTTIETWVCGTTATWITPKQSWWKLTREKAFLVMRTSWTLITGFLVLTLFSINTLLKRDKNKG